MIQGALEAARFEYPGHIAMFTWFAIYGAGPMSPDNLLRRELSESALPLIPGIIRGVGARGFPARDGESHRHHDELVLGLSPIWRGPYKFRLNGTELAVSYVPGESDSGVFGGNSNWRGRIWFPVNYLLIESMQKFHHY